MASYDAFGEDQELRFNQHNNIAILFVTLVRDHEDLIVWHILACMPIKSEGNKTGTAYRIQLPRACPGNPAPSHGQQSP